MKTEKEIIKEIENLEQQKEAYGIYIPKFVRLQINNRLAVFNWILNKGKLKQIGSRKSNEYNELAKIKIGDL